MNNVSKRAACFIAADWGTTNLRVWAIDSNDELICKRTSDQGMGVLKQDEFESVLVGLVEDLLPENAVLPIVVCGMAGSKTGWLEAKYQSVPSRVSEYSGVVTPTTEDPRISVKILPGLKQNLPEDVMRGEETQIAGFLQSHPDFSGCLCLPGTHTKWVAVENGSVESFRTSITGEMFNIVRKHSILRLSFKSSDWSENEFTDSVLDIMKEPGLLLSLLFRIRAKSLVVEGVATPTEASLSGLLIGNDVITAKDYWQDKSVYILGEDKLANLYSLAFSLQNIEANIFNVEKATLLGLIAAQKKIFL